MDIAAISVVRTGERTIGVAVGAGVMEFWNFSTAAYVEEDRAEGWRKALASLGLGPAEIAPDLKFFGIAAAITTPHGSEYVYLSSRAQQFEMPRVARDEATLLLVIEGKGIITSTQGTPIPVLSGDFVFGAPRQSQRAGFEDDMRLLKISLPRALLGPRLLAPVPDTLQLVSGDSGFAAIFADLLASLSAKLGTLTAEQFRAIDTTLVEFIATSIASDGEVAMLGGLAGRRAGLLHRVAQTIERRLAEPDLSLAEIAAENGMSVRNLQKLFEAFEKTFSTFVRSRRLARCRDDLASPLLVQLSISEICYRWGFTDPAYFSRTFREEFGVSPREFRRVPHLHQSEEREGRIFRRGRPEGAEPATTETEAIARAPVTIESHKRADGLREHHLPATAQTVHWGYLSRALQPVVEVASGDVVTVECLTHHAGDDYDRMIAGDAGAEEVFRWTAESKAIARRGAGPMDAGISGRGAGEGFGVHVLTGPIAIADARPGDVLEVRILAAAPRPSRHPDHAGRSFGSNVAAAWGFHHRHMLTEPREREIVTIYEISGDEGARTARALYNYRWTPQTDPSGIVHERIDYPGVRVDPATIEKTSGVLHNFAIPVRPHFGVIAVAPDQDGLVDSVPPSSFGGNIDNWRAGAGARIYLPVEVAGAQLSIGDPHASQGDGEAGGTALGCSLTGRFQLILHKRADLAGQPFANLTYPLIETDTEWVISGFSHPNYLEELGQNAQSDIYRKASIDFAMRDAFRKVRRFLMGTYDLSEDEALSLISVAVDFGITQVANGNWGVHAIVRKAMFRPQAMPG